MNWQSLWLILREKVIKTVIVKVGLTIASPWAKPIIYIIGKLMDKYLRPVYNMTIAKAIVWNRKRLEEKKLKELADAILNSDKPTSISVIDNLK